MSFDCMFESLDIKSTFSSMYHVNRIPSGLRNTMKTLVIHNIGNDAGLHVL